MPPRLNQMATDKNVNSLELILDYVHCVHQMLECPLSQSKWQPKKNVNMYELILDFGC